MRLEDMKQEFPETPDAIKRMIELEVQKQMKNEEIGKKPMRHKKMTVKKMIISILAATLFLGTTALAAVTIYKMHTTNEGTYATKTTVSKESFELKTEQSEQTQEEQITIPMVTMEVTYLPDNMVETEEGKYSFKDSLSQGGVSIFFYKMDMGDDQFEIMDQNVLSSEEINLNGYDGVYLEYAKTDSQLIAFDKHIYLSYPELHYVMDMYIGDDISKEEALKIASGVKLNATDHAEADGIVHAYDWSEYMKSFSADPYGKGEEVPPEVQLTATKEEMKNLHKVGDILYPDKEETKGLQIKVVDVKICDDINSLNAKFMNDDFKKEIDANGILKPAKLQYIKSGDGVNTIDEVVDTQEVGQKLVYVTLDYTNTSQATLEDVLYYGNIITLEEQADCYSIYEENPGKQDSWDCIVNTSNLSWGKDLIYCDVANAEGKNHITQLKPNETVTVHLGFVVTEHELPYLFLDLNTGGEFNLFSERSLQLGFVDIRE